MWQGIKNQDFNRVLWSAEIEMSLRLSCSVSWFSPFVFSSVCVCVCVCVCDFLIHGSFVDVCGWEILWRSAHTLEEASRESLISRPVNWSCLLESISHSAVLKLAAHDNDHVLLALFKPAVTRATWGQWNICKHNIDILSPYKIDMANVLADSCLFTHRADKQQHYHSFGFGFLATGRMYNVN